MIVKTSLRVSAACFVLLAPVAYAQDAKVLGPQSPIETYPARPAEPKAMSGLIDFPALISAPGPNDGVQITASLQKLTLEFVGAPESAPATDFVMRQGESKVPDAKRAALYAELAKRLAAYRNKPMTLGDARLIQKDVTDVYRQMGYPLMAVVVPPQEVVGGQLRVQINEFKLESYRVEYADGKDGYSPTAKHRSNDARIARTLDPLLAEPVLSQESLDQKVKSLNSNAYRSARVVFEPGLAVGQSVAQIQIEERRPWNLNAGYNNHATKSSGTHRFSLGGNFANPLLEDHQVSVNAVTGTDYKEFQNYSLSYVVPLTSGQRLTASSNYSDTASSTIPGIPGSASTTLQSSVKYERPLWENEKFQWGANTNLAYNQYERKSLFNSIVVGGADYDAVQVGLNSVLNWKESTATNQFVTGVVFNLAGLTNRNNAAHFQQFYNSASGDPATEHYLVNYARVQQLGPWVKVLDGWSTETQISGQFTQNQLAGGDNFSLGGPSVLRAYQSSEVSGDTGAYIVQFLHVKPFAGDSLGFTQPVIQQVGVSPFIETGSGRFNNGNESGLWDYGVQVSLQGKKYFSTTASLAFAGETTTSTQRGDMHFYISCSVSY